MKKLITLLAALLATISVSATAGNYTAPLYNPYYISNKPGTHCGAVNYAEYYTSAGGSVEYFSVPVIVTGYVYQITGSGGSVRSFSCTNGTIDVLDDEGYSDWN